MSRHKGDRPRTGRSFYVLGTTCGTLAVAAVVSAVYPVPEPVAFSGDGRVVSQDDVIDALDDVWFPVDKSEPSGGPLDIPDIGVVLEDYDERYDALQAARSAKKTTDDSPSTGRRSTTEPSPRGRDDDPAAPPVNAVEELPGPELSSPVDELPVEPSPAAPQVTPPASAPTVPTTPPAVSPTRTPPTRTPPTTTPPTKTPPTTTPPTTTPPPPTEEPPPPPPTDTTLALGQRYEHRDADGNVDFTITLVSIDTALACTAPDSLPAENGHLIGLQVEVVDPSPPAAGDPASVDAADFRFLGADGVLTADVDTAGSAACLENGWPNGQPGPDAPVTGTVVLDVPALSGTVVYRPASWPAGLRWKLPAAG